MSQQRSDTAPEAGDVPIVDLTGLAERLDHRARELRDATDRVAAQGYPLSGPWLRLASEARRAGALLDDVRRLLDGRL